MSIQILFGKPGSGKSYHAVKSLAGYLCDFARNEKSSGERHPERLFTNLPLNREAVQEYVERNVSGVEFDIDYYLVSLDDGFFTPPVARRDELGKFEYDKDGKQIYDFWWDKFPDDAYIVLDEMHKYLGSEYSYVKSIEETAALRNYMAEHRHHRHEWLLITQDISQIARPVLRLASQAVEVFNAKNTTLPFPISIPLADIETLLKGFGVSRQLYRVRSGTFRGARLIYDGPFEAAVMNSEIFALYTSNTLAESKTNIVGDRALPFNGRLGAVWWFAKKHAPHLFFTAFCAVLIFVFVAKVVLNLPTILTQSSSSQKTAVKELKQTLHPLENIEGERLDEPINITEPALNNDEIIKEETVSSTAKTPSKKLDAGFAVIGFFDDRIICSGGGVYRVGETVEVGQNADGTAIEETLRRVVVKRRGILFESGRTWENHKGFNPPFVALDAGDGDGVQNEFLPIESANGPDDVRTVGSDASAGFSGDPGQ